MHPSVYHANSITINLHVFMGISNNLLSLWAKVSTQLFDIIKTTSCNSVLLPLLLDAYMDVGSRATQELLPRGSG